MEYRLHIWQQTGFEMTASSAKDKLKEIIESNARDVTLLEGNWGVGKTYALESLVEKAIADKMLGQSGYAKASLFGLDTVEEINRELLTSIVIGESGNNLTPIGQNAQKHFNRAFARISSLTHNLNLPHVNSLGNLMNAVMPLMLKGKLICIDDLERKGSGLKLITLLGYLDRLREKYKCKVILITNKDMIDANEQEVLATYLEKTVDYFIVYQPSFDEIGAITFTDDSVSAAWVKEFCQKAQIKNIRVIRKIQTALIPLLRLIDSYILSAQENIVKSFCFCAWCVFDRENAPSAAFIKKTTSRFGPDKNTPTDQELVWQRSMRDVGFTNFDDLDLELLKAIESGYLDENAIMPLLRKQNESFLKRDARSVFDSMWDRFYRSFSDNDAEVAQDMFNIFIAAVKNSSSFELDSLVTICRLANRHDLATLAIDSFVEANENNHAIFRVRSNGFGRSLEDRQLIEALDREAAKNPLPIKSTLQALQEIASGSWQRPAEEAVVGATEEELFGLVMGLSGQDLHAAIIGIKKSTEIGGATILPEARSKLNNVLKRVRGVGNLNNLRLDYFR